MAERFETQRAARVRRNPWIMAAAASPFAVAVAEIAAAIALGVPQALVALPHMIALGAMLMVLAWRKNPRPHLRYGHLAADERGVSFEGEVLVPRGDLKSGFVLPRAGEQPIVRLRRRGLRLPVDVQVPSREDGRRTLRALGLDASQSVATFNILSMAYSDTGRYRRTGLVLGGVVVAFMAAAAVLARVLPQAAPFAPLGLAFAVLALTALTVIPTKLKVGADGLLVQWIRRSRFIGYGEIARIDPFEDAGSGKHKVAGLELTLRSGESVRLPVMSKRSAVRDEIYIVHERITQAVETWSRGDGVAHAALVRRAGREPSRWVRALRGIGAFANADARTAPVMPEKLWRIVEDPAAPADARAGAAVALSQTADDEGKARLRAAASAIAAPKLRFAIETAAGADTEEALTAALSEVESEETTLPKRA